MSRFRGLLSQAGFTSPNIKALAWLNIYFAEAVKICENVEVARTLYVMAKVSVLSLVFPSQ